MINFKKLFIDKHGTPNNENSLDEYIDFITTYNKNVDLQYSELHHILPRCTFVEYSSNKDNIIRLLYDDHVNAHLLLFKAYNIRAYQYPLRWMLSYHKDYEAISNAAKKGWLSLKNNKESYDKWKLARSQYMKNLSSEEQRRRCNIFWDNITPEKYLEFCEKMKNIWTDDARLQQSLKLKSFYNDPKNRENKSNETKKRYENQTEEERYAFNKKMNEVNKQIEKRNKAGNSIKKLWQNDEYRNKMMNRKPRSGKRIKLIYPDNSYKLFNSISELSKHYEVKLYFLRKFMDSNKPIFLKQNKSHIITGCYIKSII